MKRLEPEVEREVRRLAAKGHGLRRSAGILGRSRHAVANTLQRPRALRARRVEAVAGAAVAGRTRGDPCRPGPRRDVHGHRRAIGTGDVDGVAGGQRERRPRGYRAHRAHQAAFEQARGGRRPRSWPARGWPVRSPSGSRQWWSPEADLRAVAHRVPRRSDDAGEPRDDLPVAVRRRAAAQLRRELSRCLRTGRAQRRPATGSRPAARIPEMVMISERPAEVDDRAVPGHWEGDLIIGQGQHSAVGTLVERTSRFVLLLHLPDGRRADQGQRRDDDRPSPTLPAELVRTITWDQGREMARHADFSVDTGVQVYFCDPHSPWQRPLQREHQRAPTPIHAQGHRPVHITAPPTSQRSPEASTTVRARPSDR